MNMNRKMFSVCIPAFNRSKYLPSLLDSILLQDFEGFEIIVCEDCSPERPTIAATVKSYQSKYPDIIKYYENETNLGYDANIRNLIAKATGEFCYFMGNDDLMCSGSLTHVADIINRYPNVGFVLKSYSVFITRPDNIIHELRYFQKEREFAPGKVAITVCYRRSGVISGYIVRRDDAHACATSEFDGTLYYQMYLTANILLKRSAVFTPRVLVLCRSGEPPDFGNSTKEKTIYTPGRYTPQARLKMVEGALYIVAAFERRNNMHILSDIMLDYANYFYPFIKDQLSLPPREYYQLYRGYWKMGFGKFPFFHLYCISCYLLGETNFDKITRAVRKLLGRTVQIGAVLR
ncbi:MAG: glycosyltransferase family 2 protein [Acidobacteriaceae bacterium]